MTALLISINTINPAGSPTVTRSDGSRVEHQAGEFTRFEDLAAKLIQVPKAEVDAQRQQTA